MIEITLLGIVLVCAVILTVQLRSFVERNNQFNRTISEDLDRIHIRLMKVEDLTK